MRAKAHFSGLPGSAWRAMVSNIVSAAKASAHRPGRHPGDPGKDRPHQVRHLFDLVLTHLEWNTGLVLLTREDLAGLIGTSPANVSRMMGTLKRIGVIVRERTRSHRKRRRARGRRRISNPFPVYFRCRCKNRLSTARDTSR